MTYLSRHTRLTARSRPRSAEISATGALVGAVQVREEIGDDAPVLALKRTNTFYLPSKLGFEVRRQVHEPPVVVLRRACIQPQGARLEVELTALQHEDLEAGTLRLDTGSTKNRSEEHTAELQSQSNLVCPLL